MTRAHGSASCYDGGCRCADCRAAHAAYTRDYRARTGHTYSTARGRAVHQAAARYRQEHPEQWAQLLAAALHAVTTERGAQ